MLLFPIYLCGILAVLLVYVIDSMMSANNDDFVFLYQKRGVEELDVSYSSVVFLRFGSIHQFFS